MTQSSPALFADIMPVRSLLLAIFVLMAGSGLMSTLVGLRLERSGSDTIIIGIVATAYFAGLVVGATRAGRMVSRVGHIRAFAAFVALLSASTLSYTLVQDAVAWGALRFIDGLCVAGVFICLESWLNDSAQPHSRGGILATYMVALYSGQALGQLLLRSGEIAPLVPFTLASILISLSIIPICLTHGTGPMLVEAGTISLRRLYSASPLGVTGAAVTGLVLGAFYGFAAIYARRVGLSVTETASFITTAILGGVALQWPIGRLSDRFDRRLVILACFAATLTVGTGLAIGFGGAARFALAFTFGGLSFALYPLCVAHANDRLPPFERVAASGQLVLLYSIGAAIGPLGAAGSMAFAGPGGLFAFVAFCSAAMLAFAIWRIAVARPVPGSRQQHFQILPRTTPVASLLDPSTAIRHADLFRPEDRPQ